MRIQQFLEIPKFKSSSHYVGFLKENETGQELFGMIASSRSGGGKASMHIQDGNSFPYLLCDYVNDFVVETLREKCFDRVE
jgi:hypothetical protein